MYSGTIHAQNSSNFKITCDGIKDSLGYSETYNGCLYSKVYFPKGSSTLNCYGYGCNYLYIYGEHGIKDLDVVNINGCGKCSSVDYCIGAWYLYCESNYYTYGTFYGSTCSSSKCNCYDATNKLKKGFSSDSSADECAGSTTPRPTYATYYDPTQEPSMEPTYEPTPSPTDKITQYILVSERMTWATAQQYCYNQYHSNLATIITSCCYTFY